LGNDESPPLKIGRKHSPIALTYRRQNNLSVQSTFFINRVGSPGQKHQVWLGHRIRPSSISVWAPLPWNGGVVRPWKHAFPLPVLPCQIWSF